MITLELYRHDCSTSLEESVLENPLEQSFVDSAVKESLNLAMEELGVVAVVCGFEKDGPCQTLEALRKIKDEDEILPLYSCPDIQVLR